jgi:hypothetical protein
MSLRAFQHAVVELTLAPRRARRLAQGDLSVIEAYDLAERERQRLLDIVRQPGMSLNCTIARGNRFEAIGELFPMTCVLLEPILRQLLDELWEDVRPTNYQFTGEADAFVAKVQQKIAQGELPIEYLDEVFAYELICLNMAQEMQNQTDKTCEVERIVEFQHSPEPLLLALSTLNAPPAGLPSGLYRARLLLRGMRFEVEMLSAAVVRQNVVHLQDE